VPVYSGVPADRTNAATSGSVWAKLETLSAVGFSPDRSRWSCRTLVHYNFCRWHGSLTMTPAMAARIAGHPWTMEELLTEAESE
jgi:hypothetical protein